MNRLKLWVFTLLVVGLGVANVYLLTGWMTARAREQADRRLRAAAAQVEGSSRLLARQVADLALMAARDPSLLAALDPKPPPPGRGARGAAAPADPATAAEAAVRAAATSLGVDVSRGLAVGVARGGALELRMAEGQAASEQEAAGYSFLADAASGEPRQGHIRLGETILYAVGVPLPGASALALAVPLDPTMPDRVKAATGADLAVVAPGRRASGTLPAADAQGLSTAPAGGTGPASAGRLPAMPVEFGIPVPPVPLIFASPPAHRVQTMPLAGLAGGLVVLAVPMRPLLAPLAGYQQVALAVLAGLLIVGLVLGATARSEARALPRELLTAAERISRGDFEARAPRLAGGLGTVAQALNRAAEAAKAPAAAAPPGLPGTTMPPASDFAPLPPRVAAATPGPAARLTVPPAVPTNGPTAPPRAEVVSPPRAEIVPEPPAPVRAAGAEAVAPPAPAARPGAAPPATPAPGEDEERHWREVFDEFLRVRQQCGEPVVGLTFDRLRPKLEKNRDSLIQKYGCRTVRFQVYVKEGKAALKATPVR